ncbi:MAG: DUF1461 domain-containing protein [Eggerthellales bacterium]|nr:DUF1461 domain-containing protein [Eggerthellales bacterium]
MKIPAFLTQPGTPLARLITAATTLLLAFCLFGAGFVACCLPPTTQMLSQNVSNTQLSPYDADSLTNLAQTTRAYTVEGMAYPAYCEKECQALADLLNQGTLSPFAADRLRTATSQALAAENDPSTLPEALATATGDDAVTAAEAAALVDDGLALSADSVVHLDQVHQVVIVALVAIVIALILLVASFGHVIFNYGRKAASTCLIWGPVAMLAILALFLVWALADFDALFAWMHSLFFADGTWTFSVKSLLICMYPEPFWMGMGVTWLLTTCIASVISLGVGIRMKRTDKHV